MFSDLRIEIQKDVLVYQRFLIRSDVFIVVGVDEMDATEGGIDTRIDMFPIGVEIESQ